MFDLRITGGMVLDGTGADAYAADIGITGDTIVAMGDLSDTEARQTIALGEPSHPNAKPQSCHYVCPGFIDVHSHSDAYLLIEPSAPSKISQGVTTEVVGNCGASAAPLSGEYKMPSDWADKEFPGTWKTVAEYRALLEQVQPALNVVMLTGHGTLRGGAMGYGNRNATPGELAFMKAQLDQAMEEGSIGISTGLVYPPGMFAPLDEIIALATTAAARGGIYSSHMRNESTRLLAAIDEALEVGRRSGARVQISHLKARGKSAWNLAGPALEKIHLAIEEGTAVAADRYPYTSSWTTLDIMLPGWAQEGGNASVLERIRQSETAARIRGDMLAENDKDDWDAVILGSTYHPETADLHGLRLRDVAQRWDMEPVDAFLRILDFDDLRTGAFFDAMNEDNMLRILADPHVMIGSDASIRTLTGPLSRDYPHPRALGTFPRFLRMALDGQTVCLPEAVRKMTSFPAAQFGLTDRGTLAVGMKADVVVFNSATLRDKSTHRDPFLFPEGIEHVLVNGALTLSSGKATGAGAGQFLDGR